MSHQEQDQTRSSFWARLRENARSIVEQQRSDLQKQTCAPEFCLLESDKDMMIMRQSLLDQFSRDIERLKRDTCRSRLLALGTVVFATPQVV